jgi:hypothetical protein
LITLLVLPEIDPIDWLAPRLRTELPDPELSITKSVVPGRAPALFALSVVPFKM